MTDRKCGANTDRDPSGRFQTGNPGKPKGARHKTTRAAEILLEGQAEALTTRAIEMALVGDLNALKLCLERILPPRRERSISLTCKKGTLSETLEHIIQSMLTGEITPTEGEKICRLIEAYFKVKNSTTFDFFDAESDFGNEVT